MEHSSINRVNIFVSGQAREGDPIYRCSLSLEHRIVHIPTCLVNLSFHLQDCNCETDILSVDSALGSAVRGDLKSEVFVSVLLWLMEA
jgi:hypothetical protein